MITLPNKKLEGWRWSDFSSVGLDETGSLPQASLPQASLPQASLPQANFPKSDRAVGSAAPTLTLKSTNGLMEFNQAHCRESLAITIEEKTEPVTIHHQKGSSQFSVEVKPHQTLTLFEFVGTEPINLLAEIKLGQGARLTHYRIFSESTAAQYTHHVIELQEQACYDGFLFTQGAGIQRVDSKIELLGAGAKANIRSASFMADNKHSDIGCDVFHRKAETESLTHARAIIKDRAQASFRPTGFIAEGASLAQLHQLTRALLLSDDAQMNAKPELAIYHDNVECSHGVASASLDKDALYYLNARGMKDSDAKQMLMEAFIAELFQHDKTAFAFAQEKLDSLRNLIV